jgi:hypothetical protein
MTARPDHSGPRWGVDLKSRQLVIAHHDGGLEYGYLPTPEVEKQSVSTNLAVLYEYTRQAAFSLITKHGPPVFVLIEQPFGQFKKPTLQYAAGVAAVAIANSVHVRTGHYPLIEWVNSTAWKKAMLGMSHAAPDFYTNVGRRHFNDPDATEDEIAALFMAEYAHTLEVR